MFILEETTIGSIHEAYRKGTLTCEKLVSAYLERIETFDQAAGLNSIVVVNPSAIEEAKRLDALLRETGTLLPLHGIPVIVKDNIDTRGLQTAAGSAAMKGFLPVSDAFIIGKLKAAGAVVLAKSNMAEWAFSPEVTISSIAGETRNPYNLDHVPAGSSGGTAAAVASNFGAVGLGTDTGNSIRGPSSHCALVGFRTTIGLIGRSGIVPLYLRNDVVGPMTRTVEDAVRMLEVLAGPDPDDATTSKAEGHIPSAYTGNLKKDGLRGVRIGVLRILIDKDADAEVIRLFEKALDDIRSLGGIVIDPVEVPRFEQLADNQWAPVFQYDLKTYLEGEPGAPVRNLSEVIAAKNFSPYIESRLERFLRFPEAPEKRNPPALDAYSDPRRIAFREAIEQAMDENGLEAIVYPTWNNPPARIGHFEEYKGDNSQIIAPHTGQPAFTVPMGFTTNGLPAGIQFLGRMFAEPGLIRVCYAYEQGTKHRTAPAGFSMEKAR